MWWLVFRWKVDVEFSTTNGSSNVRNSNLTPEVFLGYINYPLNSRNSSPEKAAKRMSPDFPPVHE
jgi:hypothetical protein